MDDPESIGPTRHYVIVCYDGCRIEVDAEAMWLAGSCLEFGATLDVIGPRLVCVRRIAASEVRQRGQATGVTSELYPLSATRGAAPVAPRTNHGSLPKATQRL
jgi:hypothetical protein